MRRAAFAALLCSFLTASGCCILNAVGQDLHGPPQIRLLQDISQPDLVPALAGGAVEALAGCEHDGLPVVLELLQQPGLELVGVIHRQLGHEVESALGALAHHAGDLR